MALRQRVHEQPQPNDEAQAEQADEHEFLNRCAHLDQASGGSRALRRKDRYTAPSSSVTQVTELHLFCDPRQALFVADANNPARQRDEPFLLKIF